MRRLVLGATVLAFALSACGGSREAISGGPHKFVAEGKPRSLAVTVPRSLGRYEIRGGVHMVGTPAPVIGVLATDDPGAHYGGGGFPKWSNPSSNGPPANKVAFALSEWVAIGPLPPTSALQLHLPLSLHQPWFRKHLSDGRLGYRWGYLRFDGRLYVALFWSGPDARRRDRAAVLEALASVHPAR